MANISQYRSDSFYANTSMVDFYLDLWDDQVNIPDDSTATEIHTKYNLRPDLMAYDLFGSPNYWWVFALMNKDKLVDPVEDFKAGLVIDVPSNNALRSLLG
jgi:hypothetical protein